MCDLTSQCRVNRTGSVEVLHWDGGHTATEDVNSLAECSYTLPNKCKVAVKSHQDVRGLQITPRTHFEKLMTVILIHQISHKD